MRSPRSVVTPALYLLSAFLLSKRAVGQGIVESGGCAEPGCRHSGVNRISLKLEEDDDVTFKTPSGKTATFKLVRNTNGWHGINPRDNLSANIIHGRKRSRDDTETFVGSFAVDDEICVLSYINEGHDVSCRHVSEFPPEQSPPIPDMPTLSVVDDVNEEEREYLNARDKETTNILDSAVANASRSMSSIIDIMVVWTKKGECAKSLLPIGCTVTDATEDAMKDLAKLAIIETNTAYTNSNIDAQLRLVHTYREETYVESALDTALDDITFTNDGKMDDVDTYRTQYGADIVVFLVDTPGCGIGWVGPRKDRMYSATRLDCAVGKYTFGHEIGHNMGCHHDRGTKDRCDTAVHTDSFYGYRDPQGAFRTIMAYKCQTDECDNNPKEECPRVQVFSNTANPYNGAPAGNSDNNCALRHNNKRTEVENYYLRCSVNSECDDNNPCTSDSCTANGICLFQSIKICKPEFDSFPDTVTIFTDESLEPENTGIPVGYSFCSIFFDIKHEDDPAEIMSCGIWQIKRRWSMSIQPQYLGCWLVWLPQYVTKKVQIITIKDIFGPVFTYLPQTTVNIPFMKNYGSDAAGVPLVKDLIHHPSLKEHANKYNVDDVFLFVSYPTTLFYDDIVNFQKTPKEIKISKVLATVNRTWTTLDRCGNSNTWLQTIRIVKSSEEVFGDASGYQLAALGESSHIYESEVAQDMISFGQNFYLDRYSNISCSNDYYKDKCSHDRNLHPSLILDSCPENHIYQESLLNGTVMYGVEEKKKKSLKNTRSKIRKKNEKKSIKTIVRNNENANTKQSKNKKCSVLKNSKSDKTKAMKVLTSELPVNFATIRDALASKSKYFDQDLMATLLTGPQTINCTTPLTTRFNVANSTIHSVYSTPEASNQNELTLAGKEHQVYKFFMVPIHDWLYSMSMFQHARTINIETDGYLFVSVIDTVSITPLSNYTVSVQRKWDSSFDFVCKSKKSKYGDTGPYKINGYMPILSNLKKISNQKQNKKGFLVKKTKYVKSRKCKKDATACNNGYNMRNIVMGEKAQNPGTHLLVNHVTAVEYGEYDVREIPYFNPALASSCSGLRYQFSARDYENKVIQATHLFTNPSSSLELEEYKWIGGQLIFSGLDLNLNRVRMQHGLHLADESYFMTTEKTSKVVFVLQHDDIKGSKYCLEPRNENTAPFSIVSKPCGLSIKQEYFIDEKGQTRSLPLEDNYCLMRDPLSDSLILRSCDLGVEQDKYFHQSFNGEILIGGGSNNMKAMTVKGELDGSNVVFEKPNGSVLQKWRIEKIP